MWMLVLVEAEGILCEVRWVCGFCGLGSVRHTRGAGLGLWVEVAMTEVESSGFAYRMNRIGRWACLLRLLVAS